MKVSAAISAGLLAAAVLSCTSDSRRGGGTSTPRDAAVSTDAQLEDAGGTSPTPDSGLAGNEDASSGAPDATGTDAAPAVDGGDLCADGPRKPTPPPRLHIVNGTRQPTLVTLDPEQIMAVVGIASTTGAAWCSGTLIAERTVLTATHCTETETASSMVVLFGEDDFNPDLSVPVAAKLEHPTADIALLTLSFDPATQIAVRPIPIYLGTLSRADEGRMLEQAGYGDTESTTHGRYFAIEVLDSVDATTFTVDGMGQQGVCYGDSGGPSMLVAPEGDVRVLGDLSEGDAECAHRDDYVRADVFRTWIEGVTGPTPGSGPVACGTVSAEGQCTDGGAGVKYCDNGVLNTAACSGGDVCGWVASSGWRCVAPAADPCRGLAHFGTCDGQTARWCDRGNVYERNCAACGEACLFLGARIGFDCDPNPLACGELDYLGRCDGNVSEWCNEAGMRERLDCAATGQVCRYVDSEVGYYCDNP